MRTQVRFFPIVICVATFFSISSFAQTSERHQTNSTPQAQGQLPNLSPNVNSLDTVANEIGLLRKSLQTLNARLSEISGKIGAPDSKESDPKDQQSRISRNLELLSRAEQRAEVLRKQYIELIEKEASFRSRLVQIDEDLRPESIERGISPLQGTTRTPELREVRRRVLENERRATESLLIQVSQSRLRLDDDVKQADAIVSRLRQRLLPLLEKEIDKINPN
jgi:DNA repair exonuclease SbcCD ATPase subunit